MAADEDVKRFQREAEELQAQLEDSLGIEQQVSTCRAAREACIGRVSDSRAALAQAQAGLAHGKARAAAEQQLMAARQIVSDMDADATRLHALRQEISALTQKVATLEAQLGESQSAVDDAETQLRAAEHAAQHALQAEGEQARQLRRATLESELSKLSERRAQLDALRELVRQASSAQRVLMEASDALSKARSAKQRTAGELKSARELLQRVDSDVELARAVYAYTRWRALSLQLSQAEAAQLSATEQRALAEKKHAEALALEARLERELSALAERRATLPTAKQLAFLGRSQRALEIAEAALGGGLSVLVRARKPITVRAALDQDASSSAQLADERVFEAERSARISIDELVDIEVTAGGAEQRRAVEAARAVWKEECLPLLLRAGVSNLNELQEAVTAVDQADRVVREQQSAAAKLHDEAKAARERAEFHAQQAGRSTPDPSELAARRAALGSSALDALEERWAKLGKSSESSAESEHERQVDNRKKVLERVTKLEQASALGEQGIKTAEQQVQLASLQVDSTRQAIGSAKPEELELEWTQIGKQRETAEAAIAALETEHSDKRARAERAVRAAQAVLEAKKAARVAAQQALAVERETLNKTQGELSAREQQLARQDRAAAARQVERCAAAVAALPALPLATEQDVERASAEVARAERAQDEAAQEFFKAEGALSKVGGAQLREQLQQARDGLKSARARERELETDAEAWKLLREKLKLAEDSEATHLGRALGEPVGRRFSELTQSRYTGLEFDPLLSAAGLQPAGAAVASDVLAALSVGTRDQLATLVRLTIANQLKSAIILDDHLVQTDPARLAWFRDILLKTALETQVVVFTCRPSDYLAAEDLPREAALTCDLAGGTIRAVNLNGIIKRWQGATPQP
jgi:hypothetical protein